MTPAQVAAWLELGLARERMERAAHLVDGATAAQGDSDAMQRHLRELTRG